MRFISSCSITNFVVGLVCVAWFLVGGHPRESIENHEQFWEQAEEWVQEPVQESRLSERDLIGMWNRYDGRSVGQPLRFWYFHGQGRGLYRYGKVGYSQTHSFTYEFHRGKLKLKFLKTGEEHQSEVQVIQDANGYRWLTFNHDPRDTGAKYRHELVDLAKIDLAEIDLAENTQLAQIDSRESVGLRLGFGSDAPKGVGGRIWVDFQNLPSGDHEFRMYQFHGAAIDGRGVGWFHQGNFHDWTTESFSYRIDGDRLEFVFELSGQSEQSSYRVETVDKGQAVLQIERDPRDFWHRHRYPDGGASFSSLGPYRRILHEY